MRESVACRCGHSVAAVCALFASLAAAAFLAEDGCLDAGGRVSDSAWTCELASGAMQSLWSQLTPALVLFVIALVGLPVYFAVDALARRLIANPGERASP